MGRCFVAPGKTVDIPYIKSRLKDECTECDVDEEKKAGTKCDNCPFGHNSTIVGKDGIKRRRVYFKTSDPQYGLVNTQDIGKHKLFFFLAHPEMNFTIPDGSGKHFVWHFHHENGLFFDDNDWNIVLCLNTEHKWWEGQMDPKYLGE